MCNTKTNSRNKPLNVTEWTWDTTAPIAEPMAAELHQLLNRGHAVYIAVDSDPRPTPTAPHVVRHPTMWVRLLDASVVEGALQLKVSMWRSGAPGLSAGDQDLNMPDVQVVDPAQGSLLVADHPW